MTRKKYNSNNQEVEIIPVPWFPQQEKSYCCFPYSLWMVLQYYKSIYENKLINSNVPNLSIEETVKLCKTKPPVGTRVNEQLLKELNDKIPALKFELKKVASFQNVKQEIEQKQPCIIIYDCNYVINNIPSKVAHAGVVIGLDNTSIYLNNPWLGAETELNRMEFNDAWEIEYHQLLTITPNLQTNLIKDNFTEDAN